MTLILVMMLALICAVMAIRAQPLLHSALWLGGLSATVALLLYLIGAHQIAVIELSISAGLTTVLFVFAISSVGAETVTLHSTVTPLGYVLILLLLILTIVSMSLISAPDEQQTAEAPLSEVLGQDRALDMVAQIALIFVGVLGVLNLLVAEKAVTGKVRAKGAVESKPLLQRHETPPMMTPAQETITEVEVYPS